MSQFFRFALVGVLNTLSGYAVIFLCMYVFGLGAVISNVLGYAVGIVFSYFMNRSFTFQSSSRSRGEAARFVFIFAVAYLANLAALWTFIQYLRVDAGLAQILSGVIYFSLSFLLNKHYVFRPTPTSPPGDVQ